MIGIYAIVSPSGKAYIGSSRRLVFRQRRHFSDMRNNRHENTALQRAWVKYDGNLTWLIVEHCDEQVLIEREQWWIDNCCTLWRGTYNQRSIAGKAGPLDESTKEKLRAAMIGFRHTEETKQKMRKPKSAEHAAAIGRGHRGMSKPRHTEETKAKMSASLKAQHASGQREAARLKIKRNWDRRRQASHMAMLDWLFPLSSAMPAQTKVSHP